MHNKVQNILNKHLILSFGAKRRKFIRFLPRGFHLNQRNQSFSAWHKPQIYMCILRAEANLSNGICSAVILNIHVIFSIIERLSIKRLTEVKIDWLLIIDACRDTSSINKILCSLWVLKLGANDTSDS